MIYEAELMYKIQTLSKSLWFFLGYNLFSAVEEYGFHYTSEVLQGNTWLQIVPIKAAHILPVLPIFCALSDPEACNAQKQLQNSCEEADPFP